MGKGELRGRRGIPAPAHRRPSGRGAECRGVTRPVRFALLRSGPRAAAVQPTASSRPVITRSLRTPINWRGPWPT